MAKPKPPTTSLRLTPALLAEVAAWAKRNKTTRHRALVMLIERGLNRPAVAPPEAPPKTLGLVIRQSAAVPAGEVHVKDARGVVHKITNLQVGPVQRKPGEGLKKR